MKIAIITVTENGRKISRKIAENLQDCTRYAFEKHCGDEIPFSNLGELISDIFGRYDALIFVCACGTAVRVIAPHIFSKFTDPAVIAIDEQGKFAVSLLSGHIGGANALAKKAAEIIVAVPIITTATDISGRFSPDSFAAANSLYICESELAKEAASAVVNGENIGFCSDYECKNIPDIFSDSAKIGVCVSADRTKEPFEKTLHLIPKNIVVGVGCKKNASPEKFAEFIWRVLGRNGVSMKRICAVNTIDIKREETAITALGNSLNVPVNFYSSEQLMDVAGNFSHSDFVMETVGADNVCERAAAISGGKIIIPKYAENGMTAAAAELPVILDFEKEII